MWFGHAHITVCTVKQFMHHLNKFGICPHNDGCYKTLRATYHRKPCPLYRDRGAPPEEEIQRVRERPRAEMKFNFFGQNYDIDD